MSGSVTAHLFTSLNGVVESPHLFQFGLFGPEEGAAMDASLDGVTDVVMGRTLFEEWSGYWPENDTDEFAAFINPVRKHVATTTRSGDLGWNATAIDGDPVAYVRDLAERAEGRVLVAGGVETVRSLFLAGVVDTLSLTMHPAVTDDGRRLFDESVPLTRLELLAGSTTTSGNVLLTYALRG